MGIAPFFRFRECRKEARRPDDAVAGAALRVVADARAEDQKLALLPAAGMEARVKHGGIL
jgi:hypothetical protein